MIGISLNQMIYVLGNNTDPKIIIANNGSAQESVSVDLYDLMGTKITQQSLQIQVGAGEIKSIDYGDTLGALNLSEGIYVIHIVGGGKAFNIPLLVSNASSSISAASLGVPENAKIHTILIQDRQTGIMVFLPPDSPLIPFSDRFSVLIYLYDYKNKKGAIWLRQGLDDWIKSGFAKKVIVEYALKFSSIDDLAGFLLLHAKGDLDVKEALAQLYAKKKYNELARISQLYFLEPAALELGRIIDYSVDFNNLEIRIKAVSYFGFGWNSIKSVLKYAAAGALIGAGIGAAAFISVASMGSGAIIDGAIIGATFGAAYKIIKSDKQAEKPIGSSGIIGAIIPGSQAYSSPVQSEAEKGKSNLKQAYDNALNTLDSLLKSGEISQNAYNKIKSTIDQVYITGISAIDDTASECKQQISKCISDYRLRLLIGAGGSGAAGYIIGGRK